jgi:transcriptional regulator with XRE-family HTH domain
VSLLRDEPERLAGHDRGLGAGVSAKHLSFTETGRSVPSREMVLHLAHCLDVPLRDHNALLLAAGYAPQFAGRELSDEASAWPPPRRGAG